MNRAEVLRMAREAGIPDDNIPRLCHGRLETGVEMTPTTHPQGPHIAAFFFSGG